MMQNKRDKIIDEASNFVNSNEEENAVICIIKEGERLSTLIAADKEVFILNMLANVMLDRPEFCEWCVTALNRIFDIKSKKIQEQ